MLDDTTSNKLYFVMELMEGGPVMELGATETIDPLDVDVARNLFRHAAYGLEYLHFHHVIHRDLKPDNLLLATDGDAQVLKVGC